MLKNLAKIADKLDQLGLTKEADIIDTALQKLAQAGTGSPEATTMVTKAPTIELPEMTIMSEPKTTKTNVTQKMNGGQLGSVSSDSQKSILAHQILNSSYSTPDRDRRLDALGYKVVVQNGVQKLQKK
jgi:hypothetical protein